MCPSSFSRALSLRCPDLTPSVSVTRFPHPLSFFKWLDADDEEEEEEEEDLMGVSKPNNRAKLR